jgi:ferredoxin/flavodoxin---NADP+ reductase
VPGTPDSPLRVAIVGSGPAGFYAADHLLRREGVAIEVDMLDRLPTPFGLVRGGVAPDHPKIKSVIRVYEKTAARDGYRFFGNVQLGRDVSPAELAERYHAVIYAYGAETDRHLGIPGEDLPGSGPATAFVGWYNAHPDYAHLEFDLSCERAVVIGNGNVAADVTRMLALTRDELAVTDTADHAIDPLADCAIKEIVVLGRRGPVQAAFTNPELRELGEMADADIHVDPAELELDELSRSYLESEADITARKNVEILNEFARKEPEGKPRRIVLRFLASPIEIEGDGRVEAGLVLRSIGYKGVAVDGIPFDDRRGVIPNEAGRVVDRDRGGHMPGQYAVGWIKRGPSGVIGTNKKDAQDTVDSLFEDLEAGRMPDPADPGRDSIHALVTERRPDHVSYQGWQAIDSAEVERGKPLGRPRVKFCKIDEMVEVASREADAREGAAERRRAGLRTSRRGSAAAFRAASAAERAHRIGRVAVDLDEVREMILTALPGAEVEVSDETGGGDHLRAVVRAPQFVDLSRIEQHRLVKSAVQERMDDGSIHALSVRTYPAAPGGGSGEHGSGPDSVTSEIDAESPPDDQEV